MFKYTRVELRRSETTSLTTDLAPWEVPVFAAVNGGDAVTVLGDTPVNRALPDPAVEYDRLARKYKTDPADGQEWVGKVYGIGQRGVTTLAAEIAKAKAQAAAPVVQKPEYDSKDDPMLGLFDDPEPAAETEAVEVTE